MNQMMHQPTTYHQHFGRPTDSKNRVLQHDDILFAMGDQLKGIYRVNSGSIKLVKVSSAGEQQIVGFYMPGDMIGLDALADGISHSNAVALEISNVSLIPFKSILDGDEQFDHRTFIHHIGVSINQERLHSLTLSHGNAERRLAWFLTGFSDGLAKRGLQSREFKLPMTRTDLALFLGLAVETVSRELTRMSEKALINRTLRQIELLDMDRLRELASGSETCAENSSWSNQVKQPLNANGMHSLATH